MVCIQYGRRRFSFANGTVVHRNSSITERALPGEDEERFTERLMERYGEYEGTLEIVIKAGRPDYAILTFTGAAHP